VRTPAEAVRDSRVRSRGETVPLEHPEFGHVADAIGLGVPVTFSAASTGFAQHAPGVGEHNALVYGKWLGYSPDQLRALGESRVI
jgi:crotonobetainyl-CoA:carnitine CoA-transferase CaiB-like acyl-CoA transferase